MYQDQPATNSRVDNIVDRILPYLYARKDALESLDKRVTGLENPPPPFPPDIPVKRKDFDNHCAVHRESQNAVVRRVDAIASRVDEIESTMSVRRNVSYDAANVANKALKAAARADLESAKLRQRVADLERRHETLMNELRQNMDRVDAQFDDLIGEEVDSASVELEPCNPYNIPTTRRTHVHIAIESIGHAPVETVARWIKETIRRDDYTDNGGTVTVWFEDLPDDGAE